MSSKDKEMLQICFEKAPELFKDYNCPHPLDEDVMELIGKLRNSIGNDATDYTIYKYTLLTDALWELLIEKSIKCLRYYDEREPFLKNDNKIPKAYGIEDLVRYYKKYTEFERMLYGSSKYYRDHVIHVIRTWLTGIECLIKNNCAYLDFINIDSGSIEINQAEKISIWTIIALTHDLGYPLEKARDIINTTRSMMETFVTNPDISMDLSFHGVQNYMNDFIVRLMSSKMIDVSPRIEVNSKSRRRFLKKTASHVIQKEYIARLQPKYYFKFQKSLERTQHGIISTLIIYKLLTYFLESDYNINEDYRFCEEDRRQFYIRREILRSIASHTCNDIYHMYLGSFAFLLIIADDTQEWGRKYLSELYTSSSNEHEIGEIDINITKDKDHSCQLKETIIISEGKNGDAVIDLISRLVDKSQVYVTIFRDGQDTARRNFFFKYDYIIKYGSPEIVFSMCLSIPRNSASTLTGDITYSSTDTANKVFDNSFICKLKEKTGLAISPIEKFKQDDGLASDLKPAEWRKGKFDINLFKKQICN